MDIDKESNKQTIDEQREVVLSKMSDVAWAMKSEAYGNVDYKSAELYYSLVEYKKLGASVNDIISLLMEYIDRHNWRKGI